MVLEHFLTQKPTPLGFTALGAVKPLIRQDAQKKMVKKVWVYFFMVKQIVCSRAVLML